MPDFEIKGEPAGIRSRARTMIKKADLFSDTGSALRDLDTKKGWYGRSAERFGDKNHQEPTRWWEAGGAFRTGGAALNAYADALEHAQNEASRAKDEYERGEDATREAKAAYAEYEGRYNKLKSQAISDGLAYPWAKEPFSDPGDALRKNALEIFAAAKRGREDAARICAADVRSACRNAPEKRNWLENRIHSNLEILKGAGEAVWELVEMGFSKYNMQWNLAKGALEDLGLIDGSGLTAEEAQMQYQLDREMLTATWKAAKADPLEFGKQLGKGLVDWDTWADNPARAVGHLLPDIVAAILTGGTAGAASRGLRIGASIADTVGDIGGSAKGLTRAADAVEGIGDTLNVGKKLFGSAATPQIDLPDNGIRGDGPPSVTSAPDPPGPPPSSAPEVPAAHSLAPEAPTAPAAAASPSVTAEASARAGPQSSGPAPSVAEDAAPSASPASHGVTPTPDSSPAADLPGHEPSATDATRDPMSRLESRLGAVSDTGENFLESRLGGHGDVTPNPAPSDPPISQLDGDHRGRIPDPDLDDRSDVNGHPHSEDPVRPGPARDGDSDSVVEPDIDAHGPADREGIAPGEDPVHVEDHTKPEAELNRDDYPNTQDYAGEAYNRINPYLRGEYDAPPFMGADDMVDGVKRELDALPPTQEVSHRGMYMERSMVDRLFSGERFSDPAFLSTSKSPDVASNWIDELHDNRDLDAAPKDKVLVRVEGHSGRDITDISLNSGEKEILFKPGTEFEVVGRRWNDADGRWEISLREVDHPNPGGSHLDGHQPDGDTNDSLTDRKEASEPVADSDPLESPFTDHPSEWGAGQYDPVLDSRFPHLPEPEARQDSVARTNTWGAWADANRFTNNCGNTVEALELRARGYNVVAEPTVQSGGIDPTGAFKASFEGRYPESVEADWVQADGKTRHFESLSTHDHSNPHEALKKATADWPDGARGFMVGSWETGGAHYFSVAKVDGVIEIFDGQIARQDAGDYLGKLKFGDDSNAWRSDIQMMRVDNLTPTERLHDVAKPWTSGSIEEFETIKNSPDSAHLPKEFIEAESARNEKLRERNEEIITKLRKDAEDPQMPPADRYRTLQLSDELREQNRRHEFGLKNLKYNWVGPEKMTEGKDSSA